jgi:hypothetical protein
MRCLVAASKHVNDIRATARQPTITTEKLLEAVFSVRSAPRLYSEDSRPAEWIKIRKIGMICSVKPVLTEDLCVVQKEEMFNNMLYVWNIHLKKCQAYSWETNPSSRQRGCYIRTITAGVQLKKNSGRGSQGAWRQDKLIGGKPPVVK